MAEQIESCDHESDRVLARSPGREILATNRTGPKPGPRGVQGTERNQTGQERRAQGGDFVEILAIAAVDVAVAEGSGTARAEERRDRRDDDAHGFGPGPTGAHDLAVNPPLGKSCAPRVRRRRRLHAPVRRPAYLLRLSLRKPPHSGRSREEREVARRQQAARSRLASHVW